MSEIKVDTVVPRTNPSTLTIGASGDTITIPSGATFTQSGTMNASAITAGTMATARLGSGTASSSTFLRGDQTYAEAGGGKINQVLQTVKTDTFSTTSTSDFDITGMSINITPSASNSKILILANLNSSASDYRQAAWISVVRNSTQIYRGDADGSRRRATWGYGDAGSNQDEQKYTTNLMAFQYLDSPNTVSQVTYKLAAIIDAYTFYVNRTAEDGNSVTYARVPSSITAMEVLA